MWRAEQTGGTIGATILAAPPAMIYYGPCRRDISHQRYMRFTCFMRHKSMYAETGRGDPYGHLLTLRQTVAGKRAQL